MYDSGIEEKWRETWLNDMTYKFIPEKGKPLYVIDTPPPYTSGVLHMGHVLDFSLIDFLARYKRMKGFSVYYPQGWDTMGFPTERAVEKLYGKGLSGEEFIAKGKELATKNLTAMRSQMLRLGFSMDLSLEYITMSEEYQAKVQLSILDMYEKGFVYRGMHAVYWCPYCRSAIAKEETEEAEEKTKLNYLLFDIQGSDKKIEIATTRPEYLHACVAVAVNPGSEKAKELIGKEATVPIFGNTVKVIADPTLKLEYGTGAEMVCTFGDKQDLIMYHRHKLGSIKAVDESGRLLNAGKYTGLSLNDARSTLIGILKEEKRLTRQEEILHQVKIHDRCNTPVELLESTQWFIKTVEHAQKIKELAQQIEWVPSFTLRYLLDWADYVDWDWVISRNRKFDTPLPFWYCENCTETVPASREALPVDPKRAKAPFEKCKCGGRLIAEELTCDVWIDSSITPLIIAGWPAAGAEHVSRYLPAEIRVHATEIIRSWTFYTLLRTWALTGGLPFRRILIHGLVLGPDGKKMSKSLGNVVSPEYLLSKFSADAIRMWSALSGIIGKNKALVFNDVKYAYDFINKLFNSYAFMQNFISEPAGEGLQFGLLEKGILSRLNRLISDVDKAYNSFEYSAAVSSIIDFYWHDFCDFYLENIKHVAYGQKTQRRSAVLHTLREVITKVLLILAPIMPFATEELYTSMTKRSVHKEAFPLPRSELIDANAEAEAAYFNSVIGMVRREKRGARMALNQVLTRIIINLPDEYYRIVEAEKEEIAKICKAGDIILKKADTLSSEIVK